MTTYTTLTDAQLTTGKPITQAIMRALRDNPIAIAEGDSSAPGKLVVQTVEGTPYTAHANINVQTPDDDTVPQTSEMSLVTTVTITPKSTTDRLLIEADAPIMVVDTATIGAVFAFFQDSNASAIAVSSHIPTTANYPFSMRLSHEMAAGTTSSTTFKLYIGRLGGSGNVYVNGISSSRRFGGISAVRLRVKEIKV